MIRTYAGMRSDGTCMTCCVVSQKNAAISKTKELTKQHAIA